MTDEAATPVAHRARVPLWAWAILSLTVVLGLITVVLAIAVLPAVEGENLRFLAGVSVVAVLGPALAAAGILILRHQPGHTVGYVFLGLAVIGALNAATLFYSAYAVLVRPGEFPGGHEAGWSQSLIAPFGFIGLTLAVLLFPSGRLPSPRWRPVVWLMGLTIFLWMLGSFGENYFRGLWSWVEHPFLLEGTLGRVAAISAPVGYALAGVLLIAAAVSIALRYRRAIGEERQQIKWFAFFGAIMALTQALLPAVPALGPLGPLSATVLFAAGVIAILKYRLYDIDIVINKTLVYGALAAFIGAIYVGVVVVIGGVIGARSDNTVLLVAATVVVAVGFQPSRRRLQRVANRLVYGQRATPYEALSSFSERMGRAYPIGDVLGEMARVVAAGVGATRVDVWLRRGDQLEAEATWPEDAQAPDIQLPVDSDGAEAFSEADRAIPVHHQDGLLGVITFAKPRGERLTPVEENLLQDFASQAGLVMRNASLTENLEDRLVEIETRATELQASRARIVAAQDQARRRLERDIHDGAQQHLVALAVKLGLAKQLAARDPERAEQVLSEIDQETGEALDTLRDLARGIYPRTLTEDGLVAALQVEAERLPIPVTLNSDGIDHLPTEIEAAIYFSTLEALQNAAKYSQATHIDVDLTQTNTTLTFTITDNGQGFNPTEMSRGSGLANIQARLDSHNGRLQLTSEPGQGTRLTAEVPIPAMEGTS